MRRKYIITALGWTLLVIGSLLWSLRQTSAQAVSNAVAAARSSLAKDIGFRDWAASHGGVYVPPTQRTPSNPFLHVADRDVLTTGGLKLTLMNPAYVLRDLQENFGGGFGIRSHLTSLKLFNPTNAPDVWETRALQSFEQGNTEVMDISNLDGKPTLRLMRPLVVSPDCLKCHSDQNYQTGDIRGGIGAYVELQPYRDTLIGLEQKLSWSHGTIWLIGLLGLMGVYRSERSHLAKRAVDDSQIHNLAFYDTLTGLANRRLMVDRLETSLLNSARTRRYGAVLFLDIDHFKTLNDTLGHEYGDLLLVEVAKRIQRVLREVDTVARMGGDDFVVLLDSVDEHEDVASKKVAVIAEKMRKALSETYVLNAEDYVTTPSIGVCIYRGSQLPVDELLKRADMAMYRAKESGRNAVRFFDPAMQKAVETRAALEADLRRAVPHQQLLLYYQVQVDTEGRAIGAEALVRWIHPERGMVSPAHFIPISEESTLILEIGRWVLETACTQVAGWASSERTSHLTLSVNVSAQEFKQPDFIDRVRTLLREHAFDPTRLKIELTETVVLNDVSDVVGKMHALRALGVKLSMDDFGTGYSSLSYLKRLPLDQIKIDQSFVRDMTSDRNDAVMVQTIIDMAKNFRLNVIAEGVETPAQLDMLKQMGCTAFQGYLFSKPVPIEKFAELLPGR